MLVLPESSVFGKSKKFDNLRILLILKLKHVACQCGMDGGNGFLFSEVALVCHFS